MYYVCPASPALKGRAYTASAESPLKGAVSVGDSSA
jgi:hypothetical protein